MTEEQGREALRWFIERFIQTPTGRKYALQIHKFVERDGWIHSNVRKHNAMYNFAAHLAEGVLYVTPTTPESAWATGKIIPYGDSFQFVSLSPKMLI